MINGINGSSGFQGQMQGMGKRKGMEEKFNMLDADKNGGLDANELQAMTNKVSEVTGQQINVQEVSKAYDANSDGLLAMDEMQSMMMELRGNMGSGKGGMSPEQLLASYQSEPDKDLTGILLDMIGGNDEDDEDGYNPVDLKA